MCYIIIYIALIFHFSLRRHLIKFMLGDDQFCYVGLCDKHESIVVSIIPEDESEPLSTINFQERLELIEFIHTKLSELVKTFMKASRPPTPYMPCMRCYKPHIYWSDVIHSKKPLPCYNEKRLDMDYYDGLRYCQSKTLSCTQCVYKRIFKFDLLCNHSSYLQWITSTREN